jgi:hypothetical protein
MSRPINAVDAHEFAVAFTYAVTEESYNSPINMIAKNGDESLYALLVHLFPEVI